MNSALKDIEQGTLAEPVNFDFSKLIAPVTVDSFDHEFYEKKHFHVKRNNPNYYRSILKIEDIDRHLYEQVVRYPAVRLTNAKEDIASQSYVDGDNKVNTTALLKFFAEGSTIVLSGLHQYNSGLGQLVNHLSKYFFHKFQTNIYVTPKSSQGFKIHYDTHDVFVLQVHGKKTWKIYGNNPLELPNKMQEFEPGKYQHGEMIEELEMNAGDLLYIPRGIMHQAETDDALSIHVTLGWLGFTWTDLIIESVLEYSKKSPELRKFLPYTMLRQGVTDENKAQFRELLLHLADEMSLQDSINRFKREVAISQKPNIYKVLETGDNLSRISANSVFRMRKNILFLTKRRENGIILEWLGKEVEFPAHTADAVNFVSKSNKSFKISDIPDCLDDDGKLVLVTRLIKEGLLYIETV